MRLVVDSTDQLVQISQAMDGLAEPLPVSHPLYQVGEGPGRIVVGVNRVGSAGTNAVGSAVLMNLAFRVLAAGQSQLSVVNATLRDGNFDDIQGVAWFGGSLNGR